MTISMDIFLQICAGFTCVCVSGGWLIKIVKGIKKPADDVNQKLDNDNKRLNKLENNFDFLTNSNSLILKILFVVLGELAVNNDENGKIAKAQDDIQQFLINN